MFVVSAPKLEPFVLNAPTALPRLPRFIAAFWEIVAWFGLRIGLELR